MEIHKPVFHERRVIAVDLDGTLLKTDSLHESLLFIARKSRSEFFNVLRQFYVKGKAFGKQFLGSQVSLDVEHLPYRQDLVVYLREQKAGGAFIVLATGADLSIAHAIADHLGIFDEVLASDGNTNLKGQAKADLLVSKYGDKGFIYIGDSVADLEVWCAASQAIVVSSSRAFIERVATVTPVLHTFFSERSPIKLWVKELRVYQWLKNLLLFVPLLAAHRWLTPGMVTPWIELDVFFGFLSFCFAASGVYLVNDLLDLESDRTVRFKRHRPFASGDLPLISGAFAVPGLLLLSSTIGLWIGKMFLLILVVYLLVTSAYSLKLKQVPVLDVFILSSLYSLRIFAGGVAASIVLSSWLLVFSMFLFICLACLKREAELRELARLQATRLSRRGYLNEDRQIMSQFATASAYLSVLVLALYANDPSVSAAYSNPEVLLFLCPVLLYWLSRMLFITQRGALHNDPIVFLIGDLSSYFVALICAMLVFFAL